MGLISLSVLRLCCVLFPSWHAIALGSREVVGSLAFRKKKVTGFGGNLELYSTLFLTSVTCRYNTQYGCCQGGLSVGATER